MAPTVLLIGLWRDEDPAGGIPARAASLPELAAAAGLAFAAVHRTRLDAAAWSATPPAGLILSGSAFNLGEDCELADFAAVGALLDALPDLPVLGICFGHQYLAYRAGGRLARLPARREAADHAVRRLADHPAFAGLPAEARFGENHGQVVAEPGRGQRILAVSEDGIEALADGPRLGVQFHPEYWPRQAVPHGRTLLANWFAGLGGAR